ncbi:MBL fold metallo-hydrolase [Gordonia sp. CPCC 206044]|uniref:MBL fold metallo-hydrolase n=1 Tax=Gordonia sp. CPCC 206044 TaxID=3140793 RepID=UPI003AF3976E
MTSTIGRAAGPWARAATSLTAAGLSTVDTVTAGLARGGLPSARALGARKDEIARRTSGSPHLRDGVFHNHQPIEPAVDADLGVLTDMIRHPGRPHHAIPVLTPQLDDERADLSATWLGHASVLVDLDGVRILTDPVFSRRCSPSQRVGPARMHRPPLAVGALPSIDVVLISHDHYDHLDMATVVELARRQPAARFITSLGVSAHLVAWGIDPNRIQEADWWGTCAVTVGSTDLTFTCCPARHFSGRALVRNTTQWASWSVHGPEHRLFFSGDTGFCEQFDEVGARLGPFDLTLIAVGAYDPVWPDVHVNPEEAVRVHRMLTRDRGRDAVMIPIHWGTFNLARHPWAEPITRLLPSAAAESATVVVPPPGGTIDLRTRTGTGTHNPAWWEASA